MTFVGKILVILITLCAMFFLAVSTVVFVTEQNWHKMSEDLKKKLTAEQKTNSDVKAALDKANGDYKAAEDEFNKQTTDLKNRIAELEKSNAATEKALQEHRQTQAQALEAQNEALDQAKARKEENDGLRARLAEVEKQANEFKLAQAKLTDEKRDLELKLQVATSNNDDLRERARAFSSELRRNGLSADFRQIKGANSVAPPVEGKVLSVDAKNQRVVISIGSDDGLVVGHELEVWRTKPTPDYLGRIRIEATDPDRSVGIVIGKTVQGKKIQEGDNVAPTIRPRG